MSDHLCVSLVPLLNHLDLEDQKKINGIAHHVQIQKGERVFSPYSESQLIIVAKGVMKVYQLSPSGKEQLLRIVEPGGYEGEDALFGVLNDNLFGEALEATEICVLKRSDFQSVLLQYPEISLKLLEINAEKSLQIQQQAQFLVMDKIEERLAAYLLNLMKVKHETRFVLPMMMKELAAFLGTTPETLSRKFKMLESKHILIRKGRHIEIVDDTGLEALSS